MTRPVHLHNTLTRRQEALAPTAPPRVTAYACGPTVYAPPHIGNYRYFVWVDLLHRALRWAGYEVELVINVTDVDDKIIARARETGVEPAALTRGVAEGFLADCEFLRLLPAAAYPRATDHIADMVALIERLLEAGHAYRSGGGVFFRVASYQEYGALAHLDPEEMRATERVEGDDFQKEDPRDFALWKAAKPGEPSWPAPFGDGRPGWHLECSAMSMRYLGETFDLHLGGADLIFPHHENELAQSRAATGKPLARMWLHCQHLVVDGTKMSKSLGNVVTLEDLRDAGHDAGTLRYLLLSVHYRRPLNLTTAAVEQAVSSVQRLRDTARRLDSIVGEGQGDNVDGDDDLRRALREARDGFAACLADDLNIAGALGHLFTLVREVNAALDEGRGDAAALVEIRAWLQEVDSVLAVLDEPVVEILAEVDGVSVRATGPPLPEAHLERIRARLAARLRKDFAAADSLRDELLAAGIVVEDAADGGRWKRQPRSEV